MDTTLETLLDDCLLGNWETIDPAIPKILEELRKRKSALCWHKHGTFHEHLVGVTRICALWKAPICVTRCALIHSAYSNSYVNLCLFDGKKERDLVGDLVGEEAETLTWMFCTVNRHDVLYEDCKGLEKIPEDGVAGLSRKEIAYFLFLTMADFSEQFYSWQDDMFDNKDANFLMNTPDFPGMMWPGIAKPGLYLSRMSRIGHLLKSCDDICPIPPIFENCTLILEEKKEIEARDLYWEVISTLTNLHVPEIAEKCEKNLRKIVVLNPFVGEPYLLLCQVLLFTKNFEEALKNAQKGVKLLAEWGSPWDKRVSYGGWIAWGRAMILLSKEKRYPEDAFGMLNLGLTVARP